MADTPDNTLPSDRESAAMHAVDHFLADDEAAEARLQNDHEIQASPHAAAMASGFARLRFDGDLETAFRVWYWRANRYRVRLATLTGGLLLCLFALRDVWTLPQDIYAWTSGLRLGLIVPPVLAIAALTLRPHIERWLEPVLFGAALLAMVGLGMAIVVAQQLGALLPYEGLMLIAFFVFFTSGLRALKATVCVVLGSACFCLAQVYAGVGTETIALRGFYLATTCIVGLVGAYALEYNARRGFLTEGLARFRAERDNLTLLPNRRALLEHLRMAWRAARRSRAGIGLFMIDVDHFKQYNDHYGHVIGDGCLARVAHALEHSLGRPMDAVGRFGGEEFLAIAYGVDHDALVGLGERLRRAVAALDIEHLASAHGRVTISVGGALAEPTGGQLPSAAVRAADAALYAAKSAGRNRVSIGDEPTRPTLHTVGGHHAAP